MVDYKKVEHIIDRQAKAEEEFLAEFRAGNYTINNPLVKLNPYLITPLTAVILFKTPIRTEATITVLGKEAAGNITHTFPAAKEHILPIYGLYADYAPAPGLPDSPASSLLANAVFLIRSNFHHEYFHTEQLCQMLGVSRSTLYRAFQSELNISPGEFLSNFRIHQACRLLELGNSVKTAAVSCGFSDAFYFSRAFHRRMGVSPSDYRRQPQKQDAGSEYSRLVF